MNENKGGNFMENIKNATLIAAKEGYETDNGKARMRELNLGDIVAIDPDFVNNNGLFIIQLLKNHNLELEIKDGQLLIKLNKKGSIGWDTDLVARL